LLGTQLSKSPLSSVISGKIALKKGKKKTALKRDGKEKEGRTFPAARNERKRHLNETMKGSPKVKRLGSPARVEGRGGKNRKVGYPPPP